MRPTPGTWYTVQKGDTIRNIARAAYGNDQSRLIVQANRGLLAGREPSLEGLPTIRPNEKLQIPASANRYGARKITADFENEIVIEIEGTRFHGFKASKIVRAINNIANGFTFEAPFDPTKKEQVELFRPFKYKPVNLYIGGEPYLNAQCVKWSFREDGGQVIATVEARTKSGDMIECMLQSESHEYSGFTLLQIAKVFADSYGFRVYSEDGDTEPFLKASKESPTETDFEFLTRLAAQKGFLVTSAATDAPPGITFARAAIDAKPVATLKAGEFPVKSVTATHDGTKRFSSWTAVGDAFGEPGIMGHLADPNIPALRHFCFTAPEVDGKTIDAALAWRVAKSVADASAVAVRVVGWRNADGQLWSENTKVIFQAPAAYVFEETEFLVQSVELTKDESGGDEAILFLVLPGAYASKPPELLEWESEDKSERKLNR